MKQRKDANDDSALEKYDNPPTNGFKDKLWKLRRDGKEVEDLLQDIIKKKRSLTTSPFNRFNRRL